MENMENLLNIYNQLRSCTNPDVVDELKRNFKGSFRIKKRKKESDRDSCKNVGSKELGIRNVGKSRMLSVADKSREVDNLINEAKELAEIGKFGEDLTIEVHDEMQVQFPTSNLVGDKFTSYIHEISDLLTKNKASTIGVWGMGGVGKTTLIKHLHNLMLDKPQIYGNVYWITVSKDCTIQKLQNDIANKIGASIFGVHDELQRAGILAEALKMKKKFVLILDDMWSDFDSNEVGLRFPKEIGYRLIVTSRSKDVCLKMYCDNIIKVDPLSPEDARTLFVRSIGREIPDDLLETSIDVVDECAGLPLGIITLAKSMIGCNDVCEWRDVLDELKNSSDRVDDMEKKVFKVLKLSYERLNDELKECLLYCAIYPEDYLIDINDLIWLFIDAGLLGKNVGMAKMFDKGVAILRKLERVALLSIEIVASLESEFVRLHDLIRDMTLQTAGSRFMIKAGIGLKDIPDEESWTDKLEVVSLMDNQIKEISDLSPKCNRLSTLLLHGNFSLSVVCDGFFRYLDGLKLLDLSYSSIKTLPESISLLKNLTTLILMWCEELEKVSSLAELRSLERLNLCGTRVSQLPEGIGSLIKLRYLDLYNTKIERIGVGVISKLTALQYLAIQARIDVNELNSLNNLEHLTILFEDFVSFSAFIQQMKIKGRLPNFYVFFVGKFSYKYILKFEEALRIWRVKQIYLRKTKINQYDCLQRITFSKDSSGYSIVDDIQLLDIYADKDVMSLEDYVFDCACNVQRQSQIERGSKPFSNLKCLRLCKCPNLKKLFPLGLLSNLQNMEKIHIGLCEGLEELMEEARDETKLVGITNPKTLSLPKLEYIRLEYLPNLKRVCRDDQVIRIPLQKIVIIRCPKLKRMPLDLDKVLGLPLPQMDYLEGEKEWVKSLEWDPPESKSKMHFHAIRLPKGYEMIERIIYE